LRGRGEEWRENQPEPQRTYEKPPVLVRFTASPHFLVAVGNRAPVRLLRRAPAQPQARLSSHLVSRLALPSLVLRAGIATRLGASRPRRWATGMERQGCREFPPFHYRSRQWHSFAAFRQ
jgi:hypothetical protein